MELQLGAHVRTQDGEDLGTIDKLIVDPLTSDVKSTVVRMGGLLSTDVEIPLQDLYVDDAGRAAIGLAADEVGRLTPFYADNYTEPPPDYVPPFAYPVGGILWPSGASVPYPVPTLDFSNPVVAEGHLEEAIERRAIENAVVEAGTDVVSRDGEKIGVVETVVFDAGTGHPSAVVVSGGHLFKQRQSLPADLIGSAADGVVYLSVDCDELSEMVIDSLVGDDDI